MIDVQNWLNQQMIVRDEGGCKTIRDAFTQIAKNYQTFKMFSSTSREHCQSKYYKEWHPDYIAAYNSLQDPNLKHFFKNPQRKTQMVRSKLVSLQSLDVYLKKAERCKHCCTAGVTMQLA